MQKLKRLSILIMFSIFLSSCSDCEPYGAWQLEDTTCDPNFWCFFKSQQATYNHYIRIKQCENGQISQSKKSKKNCGC